MNRTFRPSMPVLPDEPLLHFRFPQESGGTLTFCHPVAVVTTRCVNEVEQALRSIEDYISQGYYAAGYLSYESAPAFDPAMQVRDGSVLPLLWFGIFAEPVQDEEWAIPQEDYEISEWTAATDKAEYTRAIAQIKEEIARGETYQVNYTFRLNARFKGSAWSFFHRLVQAQEARYSAYLQMGPYRVLSVSPELFFEVKEGTLTARPMKGTIKRGLWPGEDRERKEALRASAKDRAENVMIVDLLRSDIGRLSKPGTVRVPQLYEIEPYPTVYQMTSTVQAELREHVSLTELFTALFPCGSVTGAPKINTMKIISELEQAPREVYCGAIGYVTPKREMVFNVPIRTVWIDTDAGTAEYAVGGGVTWDSSAEGEYEEALAKAEVLNREQPVFALIESLRLAEGSYWLLARHLERLRGSAEYFGYPYPLARIEQVLQEAAAKRPTGAYKIKLTLTRSGELQVQASEISSDCPQSPAAYSGEGERVTLAQESVSAGNVLLYHKTTARASYDRHYATGEGAYDVLLYNERGELTEFTRANVALEMDGILWTPPVATGLLAGTLREELLAQGALRERVLTLADLDQADAVWFINSVRGFVKVALPSERSWS